MFLRSRPIPRCLLLFTSSPRSFPLIEALMRPTTISTIPSSRGTVWFSGGRALGIMTIMATRKKVPTPTSAICGAASSRAATNMMLASGLPAIKSAAAKVTLDSDAAFCNSFLRLVTFCVCCLSRAAPTSAASTTLGLPWSRPVSCLKCDSPTVPFTTWWNEASSVLPSTASSRKSRTFFVSPSTGTK